MATELPPGTRMTAEDHWNPAMQEINQATADIAVLQNGLAASTSSGGLSGIDSRFDTVEATAASNTANITTLRSNIGNPYSNANSLDSRVTNLETAVAAKGYWYQAPTASHPGQAQTLTEAGIIKLNFGTTGYQTAAACTIAANRTDITLARAGSWLLYGSVRLRDLTNDDDGESDNRTDWVRIVTWFGLSSDSSTRYGIEMAGPGLNGVNNPGVSYTIPIDVPSGGITISQYVLQDNTANADMRTFTKYTGTQMRAQYVGP